MALRNESRNCAGMFAGAKGPCVGPATLRCGSCGAPNYCSRPHQIAHWKEHQKVCDRMAQQMARAGDLIDFPFTFAAEATQLVDEGALSICSFLEKRELHLKGLWQGECKCVDAMLFKACYSADPPRESGEQLRDWAEYYKWRVLPLDSPVAILMHWPLTLYYAFKLISERFPPVKLKSGSWMHVHYIGPEKELQLLHVFAELIALLPDTNVHIDMIGPAVPASRDGELLEIIEFPKCLDPQCTCKEGRGERSAASSVETETAHRSAGLVTLKLWHGLYHDMVRDLKLLTGSKTPAMFTDYCEEAADFAASALSSGHPQSLTYPVQRNPFRQPLSTQDKLLNLPTYSKCFIFGIN